MANTNADAKHKAKIKEIFNNLVESDETEIQVDETITKRTDGVTCNPQSKDLFLERVKTFTTTNWAAKPVELSPLHCAQYGWCNDHIDQLRCVTCNATIYAGIPDEWDSTAYTEICNKIQNDLQIGHEKLCPWPKNPCPLSFLSLPTFTAEQWKLHIGEAFDGLVQLRGSLPELNEDEIASMSLLDNSVIELLLSNVLKYQSENDDEALQGKVACILALCGWSVNKPVVEDPSINCIMCSKESGLWNYKNLSHRSTHHKRHKTAFECYGAGVSQQSLADYPDAMSSNVSIKSEKSENSTHSGSMIHELSKLATSSDSLAQSDLLKPADSQESLVNLRVSDSKTMYVDHLDHQDNDSNADSGSNHGNTSGGGHQQSSSKSSNIFPEPKHVVFGTHVTPPELMKELLLSRKPNNNRTHSIYSDSIFSEVGSECFEKRLEDTTEKDLELDKAVTENPPSSQPNQRQQQWMKELLFMTAESKSSATESVMSEIGSIAFDRRIDNSSILNSPRATTPVYSNMSTCTDEEEGSEPMRTKRMRFQEPDITVFSILQEHRHWCPWISSNNTTQTHGETDEDSETTSPLKKKRTAGWKLVLTSILPSQNNSGNSTSTPPPAEAWRSVRSVLGECVSTSPPAKT